MLVTLNLPDNIQSLPVEKQKERLFLALKQELHTQTKENESKWKRIAEELQNNPNDLNGYSKNLKKDMLEFRESFSFKHDA